MNNSVKLFFTLFAVALFVACSTSESELLKQARTIQDGLMKSKTSLDSTIDAGIAAYNDKITKMSSDSVWMADTSHTALFTEAQEKVAQLGEFKSKLTDWGSSMKMLPAVSDLAKGVENPFGKDAKDQDILNAIKASQDEFNALKSEIETALQ